MSAGSSSDIESSLKNDIKEQSKFSKSSKSAVISSSEFDQSNLSKVMDFEN
jgi:hypothetical protein